MKNRVSNIMHKAKSALKPQYYEMFCNKVNLIDKRKQERVDSISVPKADMYDRKLSEIIAALTALKEKHGDVELSIYWDYYEDFDFKLDKPRKETDLEQEERIFNLVNAHYSYCMNLQKQEERKALKSKKE